MAPVGAEESVGFSSGLMEQVLQLGGDPAPAPFLLLEVLAGRPYGRLGGQRLGHQKHHPHRGHPLASWWVRGRSPLG